MQNLAGRDSRQGGNRVDSKNHVQNTQHSEKDIIMLSGIEKSVALKHEEPENPTLIHRPYDEVSKHVPDTSLSG